MSNFDERNLQKAGAVMLALSLFTLPQASLAKQDAPPSKTVPSRQLSMDQMKLRYYAMLEDGRHVVVMEPKSAEYQLRSSGKGSGFQVYLEDLSKSKLELIPATRVNVFMDGGSTLVVTGKGTFVFPSEAALRQKTRSFTFSESTDVEAFYPPPGIPMKRLSIDASAKEQMRKLGLPLPVERKGKPQR